MWFILKMDIQILTGKRQMLHLRNIKIQSMFCLLQDQHQKFHFRNSGQVEIIKKSSRGSFLFSILEDCLTLLQKSSRELQNSGESSNLSDSTDSSQTPKEIWKKSRIPFSFSPICLSIVFFEERKSPRNFFRKKPFFTILKGLFYLSVDCKLCFKNSVKQNISSEKSVDFSFED